MDIIKLVSAGFALNIAFALAAHTLGIDRPKPMVRWFYMTQGAALLAVIAWLLEDAD
ncbi:hypothetical protein [Puniceibacterium sp. IMCC21224]|uniref:hypothetical protein n=1 Tax=Puniceibacterium sp. IMCC21224 TaxID=1618204 RepID=UPI00065DBA8D|nr:hypothetical protein [Puniceibacterium sp. IMCC21224]KMK67039.1 hypothetical protein IMCC21224_111902 [Puniceibacterium sp. IMCC21224]